MLNSGEMKIALIEAVKEALSAVSLSPKATRRDVSENIKEGISSKIYLKGDIVGRVIILLDKSSACSLVSKMLDQELADYTEEVLDGVGEILNMIIGGVKMKCATSDLNFEISIPSTLVLKPGEGLSTLKGDQLKQSFECDDIEMQLILIYKKSGGSDEKKKDPDEGGAKLSATDMLSQLINKNN